MGNVETSFRGESFSAVLVAAQAGASWALTDIWLQLSPAVAAFLTVRGSDEPEDLTSEVFLTVFEQLPNFRGSESQFRSFVFTIAYRRLVDELRKRSRRGFHVEWSDESDPRTSGSAEQEALHRIGEDGARRLVESLPPEQRNVLMLRIFGDLTVEQVATILGKRTGAVKALQRRGLEGLRKKISRTRTPERGRNDSEG